MLCSRKKSRFLLAFLGNNYRRWLSPSSPHQRRLAMIGHQDGKLISIRLFLQSCLLLFQVSSITNWTMALWNYDAPRFSRDPWDLFEPEPFESTLFSSPFGLPRRHALRSHGSLVREVASDKDKYQVASMKIYVSLFFIWIQLVNS